MKSEICEKTGNFSCLPIVDTILEKIKLYARLAKDSECYGFLLSPKEINDGTVYGAILAPNQKVSGGSSNIDGLAAAEAKAEIENLGCNALGFWHSHGHSDVFHSGIDNANMDNLLLAFAGNTEERQTKQAENYCYVDHNNRQVVYKTNGLEYRFSLENWDVSYESKPIPDDYFQLVGEPREDIVLAITRDNQVYLRDERSRILMRQLGKIEIGKCTNHDVATTGFAYSIVVNNRGKDYAEIAVVRWCSFCNRDGTEINRGVPLNPISLEPKVELDKEKLLRDLEERVFDFRRGLW